MEKTRALVMIDGQSLFYSSKDLGKKVNYEILQDFLFDRYSVIAFRYYNMIPKGEKTSVHSLAHYLTRIGYVTICPEVDFTQRDDDTKEYSMSVHDMLSADLKSVILESTKVETVVLVSHDSSLRHQISTLQLMGIKTVLIGTRKSERPRVSYPLLASVGNFIELSDCRFLESGESNVSPDDQEN